MATVKEEQLALEIMEKNLKESENLLEKQKLEHDEKFHKKENLIIKVNRYI